MKEVAYPKNGDWTDGLLGCPTCGATEGLHQAAIEVFDRTEDAKDGIYAKVSLPDVHISVAQAPMKNNPSLRREGLTVNTWCEICGCHGKIHIVQHKGGTYMYGEAGDDITEQDALK